MLDLFDSLARHIESLSPESFTALMRSRPDVADALFPGAPGLPGLPGLPELPGLADAPTTAAIEVEIYPLAEALVAPEGVADALLNLSRSEIQVLMALAASAEESNSSQGALGFPNRAPLRASQLYVRLLSGAFDPIEADARLVRKTLCAQVDKANRSDASDVFDEILAHLTDMCLVWPDPESGLTRLHDVLPSLLPEPGPDWDGFEPLPLLPRVARLLPVEQVDAQAQAAAIAALDHADRLLRHIAAEPVALLKVGGVGSREIKRLVRTCGLDEQKVRLWLHVAENAQLVVCHEGQLIATPEYDEWLAAEPDQRYTLLFAAWMALPTSVLGPFTPSHNGLAPAPLSDRSFDDVGHQVRALVLGLLTACGAGAVADPDSLAEAVAWHVPLLMEDYLDEAEPLWDADEPAEHEHEHEYEHRISARTAAAAAVTTVLVEAAEVGAVALGAPALVVRAAFGTSTDDVAVYEADLAAAMSATLPTSTERVRVQGDMTVVAAGLPSARLAALFDAAAERQPAGGTATIWRITDASVRRWLDAGRTAEELLAGLAEFCDDELPQPLRYLIEDAGQRHGQVDVIAAQAVVVAADAALAAELAVLPALVKLGARRVTDTVLVLGASPEETLAVLRFAGYLPSAHHSDGSPVVAIAAPRRAAPGIEVISSWSWP